MAKYKIYEGKDTHNPPVYTVEGKRIYPGNRSWGKPAFTISKNQIFEGQYGIHPVYTIRDDCLYIGNSREVGFKIKNGKLYRKRSIAYTIVKVPDGIHNMCTTLVGVLLFFILTGLFLNGRNNKDTQTLQKERVKVVDQNDRNVAESSEFIFPESDSRYLTDEEVSGLTKDEVRFAINEIYARRGRKFETPELNEYFSSKSWYDPKYSQDEFSEDVFNEYEKANINLLVKYR